MLLRGRNTEGVGEGAWILEQSVPSGQQRGALHHRTGGDKEDSAFTTGAGLSQ